MILSIVFIALFLIPATVACGYYWIFTSLGWHWRRSCPAELDQPTIAVLIPAHNEAASIRQTLQSLQQVNYPSERLKVFVVADNCTDETAEIVKQYEVVCWERHDQINRGKGAALEFAIPRVVETKPDLILILDADCRVEPGGLQQLAAELQPGVDVAQAAVTMGDVRNGVNGLVMRTGSELENAAQAGLSRLGLSVRLRGTGMLFRREIFERFPWQNNGLVEDAEFSARLRQHGVRIRFTQRCKVYNSPPLSTGDLCKQRARWREALLTDSASFLDRLMTSKPLVLGHLFCTITFALFIATWQPTGLAIGCLALAGMLGMGTVWLYIKAMSRAGAGSREMIRAVKAVPVLCRLIGVTIIGLFVRGKQWERTGRVGEPVANGSI